jgi:hypothetical protein
MKLAVSAAPSGHGWRSASAPRTEEPALFVYEGGATICSCRLLLRLRRRSSTGRARPTRPTVSLPAPHLYDSHPWQLVRRLASTTSIGEDPGEAWPKPLISPQIPLHVSDSPLITGPGMSPWVKNADVCLRQVFCTTASMLRLPTSSCKEEEETRHARRYPHPFGRNISKGRPVKARTDPLQAAVRRFVPFATCPADPPDLGQGISESQHGATLLFSTAAASITSASQKLHLGMV